MLQHNHGFHIEGMFPRTAVVEDALESNMYFSLVKNDALQH